MKKILNPRTVRVALAQANKRLAEIETVLGELQAERDAVNQLRIVLEGQLPLEGQLALSMPDLPPEPRMRAAGGETGDFWTTRVQHDATDPRNSLVESGDCLWAIGPHQRRMIGENITCLAPEEQLRKP